MPSVKVPVSNGLNTSQDPSLLDLGELTRADDCEYQPSDPAVWKVRGRQLATSTPESSSIYGARFLEFDGAADLFVVGVGTTYRKAQAGLSGLTFSNLVTGLSGGLTLDSIHYSNNHYLLNGVDRNRYVDSTGTANFHGMLANTSAPTLTLLASGAGITLSTNKTIIYWLEERVKSGSAIVRRNATISANTVTWTGAGTAQIPTVASSTTYTWVNSDATHIALFATATNGTFPTGAQIAEYARTDSWQATDTRGPVTDPGIPSGSIYETISVSISGTSTNVARNGPPPVADTGDVLEDSLVLNDKSDLSKLWYSWPDEPHKFPAVNFIDFNTKEADEIRCIRRLGSFILVLMRDSVWRINFLPRPEDAEFDRGRVKEQVEGAHGCVSPLAADTFSFGEGLKLAYVSGHGLLVTDGYYWDVLSNDLDWDDMVDVSRLGSSILINNPVQFRLEFGFQPVGGGAFQWLFFHYHPSHAKPGERGLRAKITGPVHRPTTCMFVAHIDGQDRVFSGSAGGNLYLNDSGATEPIGTLAMVVRTGDLYLVGQGGHFRLTSAWAHHIARPGQTADMVTVSRNSGYDDVTRKQFISLKRREPTRMAWEAEAECAQLGFENNDTIGPVNVNYFVAELESLGETEEA